MGWRNFNSGKYHIYPPDYMGKLTIGIAGNL